jgi:hypothetical protein
MAFMSRRILLFLFTFVLFVSGCSTGLPANRMVDLAGMTLCDVQINNNFLIHFFDDNNYFSGASVFCPGVEPTLRNLVGCKMVFERPNSKLIGMVFIKERVKPPSISLYFNAVMANNCARIGVNVLFPSQDHALLKQGYDVYEGYYVE